jgi:hypothetical protein
MVGDEILPKLSQGFIDHIDRGDVKGYGHWVVGSPSTRYSNDMPVKLPTEDEELWSCFFCRKWHGFEVFCPITCVHWLKRWYRLFKQFIERWLERLAYSVAIFAMACFVIALAIALGGLLRHLILE